MIKHRLHYLLNSIPWKTMFVVNKKDIIEVKDFRSLEFTPYSNKLIIKIDMDSGLDLMNLVKTDNINFISFIIKSDCYGVYDSVYSMTDAKLVGFSNSIVTPNDNMLSVEVHLEGKSKTPISGAFDSISIIDYVTEVF